MKRLFFIFLLCPVFCAAQHETRIDSLLGRMTLHEKAGQLNQLDGRGTIDQLKELIRRGELGSVMNVMDPVMVNELQRIACEESPARIPLVFARDVVHGFKTMLPIPLGQAATFDPELVKQGARMAAAEATEHGIRWSFAPMADISRDARWGRIAEGFGEDTYLNAVMAAAVVEGYQGKELADPSSMAACVKHFVGYGAAEGGRDYNATHLTERQMREFYLPPFHEAVQAGCASVMTAFNDNDGIPCTANRFLLHDVLRGEWGFDGVVVSDWGAVGELVTHGYAGDRADAAVKALTAGTDMDMSSKIYIENIEKLVASGRLTEAEVDAAVRRVLRLKMRLGLFDNPYTEIAARSVTGGDAHLAVARKAAEESVVLLANRGTLPLGNFKKIVVAGPLADAPHDQLGTWTMDGDTAQTRTPARVLKARYGKRVEFIPALRYSRDRDTSDFARVAAAAAGADAVILFLGEEAILTGEAHSLAGLELQGAQTALLERLAATGTPVVAVFMAGRPLAIPRECTLSSAVLYAWHPGTMGGEAIADILTGKANPSGKLPASFPRMSGQSPLYYNHSSTGRPASGKEKPIEQIPVNARQSVLGHSSYYLDAGSKPLFPFGFGLSYTTFELGGLTLSADSISQNDTLRVSVTLRNTGRREGTQALQLYVRDHGGSVTRPVKELKRIARVTLAPGASERVEFTLTTADLAFWGADMRLRAEPGKFTLTVGMDSQSGLSAPFSLAE